MANPDDSDFDDFVQGALNTSFSSVAGTNHVSSDDENNVLLHNISASDVSSDEEGEPVQNAQNQTGLDEIPIWTEDNNIIIENLTNDDAMEINFDLQPTIMTVVLDSTDKVLQTTNLHIGQTVETVTSCNPGLSAQECDNLENDSTRPTATSNSTIVGLDLEHPSAYKIQVNDEVVLNQRKPDLLQINDKSISNNYDALPITTNTTSAEPGRKKT
ncbi:hypothetical protein J6590_095448 [Homalodisca vitripennis]|nr:hypothetical protein J6590_095448 [Homalodisca vitripennis]